jgi:hypothetical protein
MVKPKIGDFIEASFDVIGLIEGEVSAITDAGFVMSPDDDILARLREQISFLAETSRVDAARRHFRIKARNPETNILLENRSAYPAYVLDFSLSGACIETDAPLDVGDEIAFPRFTCAKIVRAMGNRRFGVEFKRAFRPHEFTWYTRL